MELAPAADGLRDYHFMDGVKLYKWMYGKETDLYFNYPHKAAEGEIYQIFKEVADTEGTDMPYFMVNPFTATLVDLMLEKKIPQAEAFKYQALLKETITKGVADCEGRTCEAWKVIESYAPIRLEDLETIKGFYDCL